MPTDTLCQRIPKPFYCLTPLLLAFPASCRLDFMVLYPFVPTGLQQLIITPMVTSVGVVIGPFPWAFFLLLLFINRVNKRASVSKKPDETNNIPWPKWRHLTREEWSAAISADQKLGSVLYGSHHAPGRALAANEIQVKIPIIASFLPNSRLFSFGIIFIICLKMCYRFKCFQITSGVSFNLLFVWVTSHPLPPSLF